jgi:hypothetical protein
LRPMPIVQLRQQYAKIGIDADIGKQDIRQPRPDFQITTKTAKLETTYLRGEQRIDQSASWDALGIGSTFAFSRRIADESKNLALQGIGKRVDIGNRLAAIHLGGNPIADMARESFFEDFKINYEGPFSTSSVDIEYTPHKPEANFEPGSVDVESKPNAPQINYTRGKLDIYMLQMNSIQMIPPEIDVFV